MKPSTTSASFSLALALSPRLACMAAVLLLALAGSLAATTPPGSKPRVQELTNVLRSQAGQKEKADACRELAWVGDRSAIAALAALLPDESLSHMARYALETIPGPEVDKAFRTALPTLHGRPLVGVIGSIGVRRDTKAAKPLSRLLAHSDPDISQAAARALGNIATSTAVKALQKALPASPAGNQLAVCEGLLRCAEKLAAVGQRKPAIAIYDSLLQAQAGHQVRTAALRGALLTRQADGMPLLIKSLTSTDYAVFAAAARASLEMPGASVTRALATEVSRPPADRQILLTQILSRRGDAEAVPALIAVAKTGGQPVKVAALRAISEFGDPSAIPTLVELMNASDREVAQVAQEGLASLPGKEADAAVLAMLRGADENRRSTAMDLVVRRRMTSAIPELYTVASGPNAKLRVAAIRSIAELADQRQIPGMLGLLSKAANPEDLEATEQALASIALKSADRDASAQSVAAALSGAQPGQKCALIRVLGSLGGASALTSVRAAIGDPTPEVRTAAIRALGSWNGAETAPDLLQLARSASDPKDKVLSLRSYLGLASQPELPANARLDMCREAAQLVQTPDEKKLLLAALGNVRSPEALPLILQHLDDAATRNEAAAACLSAAGKLLEGNDAAKNASALIEPLQKVSEACASSDLGKKALSLLEKARAKR